MGSALPDDAAPPVPGDEEVPPPAATPTPPPLLPEPAHEPMTDGMQTKLVPQSLSVLQGNCHL